MPKNLPIALLNRDSEEVVRIIHDLLVSISFHQHPHRRHGARNPSFESERVYHVILHASFLSAVLNVTSEAFGGEERTDITIFVNDDMCVVIELKCCTQSRISHDAEQTAIEKKCPEDQIRNFEISAALDSAEDQMRKKDYAGPYWATRHKVICMALAIRGRSDVAVRFIDV
jgi:hypothetical protein